MTSPFPAGTKSVTISFTTSVSTNCKYSSVDQQTFAGHVGVVSAANGGTTHSVTIGSTVSSTEGPLSDGTDYKYFVECKRSVDGQNDPENVITFRVNGDDKTFLPNDPLQLVETYESISVYTKFSNDANFTTPNKNTATLSWKLASDTSTDPSSWHPGMELTEDRRPTITSSEWDTVNLFKNQWRGSLIGLKPETEYQVKVTLSDPDGVACPTNIASGITCTNVSSSKVELVRSITTKSYNFPAENNRVFNVASGGNATSCSDGATFSSIQTAVNCATQPGDSVVVNAGTYNLTTPIKINNSGSANGYITIKAQNPSVVLQAGVPSIANSTAHSVINSVNVPGSADCGLYDQDKLIEKCGFVVTGSFVKLVGFEIINARIGIQVSNSANNIVLENNYIHDNSVNVQPQHPMRIGNNSANNIERVTVQHNWVDGVKDDPTGGHVITFVGTKGKNVARSNYINFEGIWGGNGEHGTDCIGSTPNDSVFGLGADSDIYNNICNGATDDGLEPEGNGMNNRVWGNKIFNANLGIAVAPIIVGPTYVFRNTFYDLKLHWTHSCIGTKTGEGGTGNIYFYHNTWNLTKDIATNCEGVSKSIASNGGGIDSLNVIYKNNIFHGWTNSVDAGQKAAATNPDVKPLLDYNLHFRAAGTGAILKYAGIGYTKFYANEDTATVKSLQTATGQEMHGIYAEPKYKDVNAVELLKDLHLTADSPGVNKGVILAGFNDQFSAWPFSDSAPEMGAYELGSTGPLVGDIDKDGRVGVQDYGLVIQDFGKSDSISLRSDINGNGRVDVFDFNLIQSNYGKTAN